MEKIISFALPLLIAILALTIALAEPDSEECAVYIAITFASAFWALINLAKK